MAIRSFREFLRKLNQNNGIENTGRLPLALNDPLAMVRENCHWKALMCTLWPMAAGDAPPVGAATLHWCTDGGRREQD